MRRLERVLVVADEEFRPRASSTGLFTPSGDICEFGRMRSGRDANLLVDVAPRRRGALSGECPFG